MIGYGHGKVILPNNNTRSHAAKSVDEMSGAPGWNAYYFCMRLGTVKRNEDSDRSMNMMIFQRGIRDLSEID